MNENESLIFRIQVKFARMNVMLIKHPIIGFIPVLLIKLLPLLAISAVLAGLGPLFINVFPIMGTAAAVSAVAAGPVGGAVSSFAGSGIGQMLLGESVASSVVSGVGEAATIGVSITTGSYLYILGILAIISGAVALVLTIKQTYLAIKYQDEVANGEGWRCAVSLTSFNYKAGISPVDSIVNQIEALAIKREKIDQLEAGDKKDKKLRKLDKKRKALDKKFMQNAKFYEAVYDIKIIDKDILPTSKSTAGYSEALLASDLYRTAIISAQRPQAQQGPGRENEPAQVI